MKQKKPLEYQCSICAAMFAYSWRICPECANIDSIIKMQRPDIAEQSSKIGE